MIELVPVTRLGVRDAWGKIVHGIDDLYAEHKGPWMPEDVYSELVNGRVTLYLMQKDDVTKGFFVARANADFDGVVLFIWLMWTEPHAFELEEVLPEMDKLAKMAGARRIRHESTRKGWVGKGFELTGYLYEREVQHVSQNPA